MAMNITQSSTTGASQSDGLVSYPENSIVESYPAAEIHSVVSTSLVKWAELFTKGYY